ncbi:MAG: hypothetical protein JXR81_11600 [Candidatus Goldbacteria bacterium]|nr:hypothetical protein [Candidatus Goldiibacteriota bacterium]
MKKVIIIAAISLIAFVLSAANKDVFTATEEFASVTLPEKGAVPVSFNSIIIDFSCYKTVKKGTVNFCPLALDKEAKYISFLSVRKLGNNLLCRIIMPQATKEQVKADEESESGGEYDFSEWETICLLSGNDGKLIWSFRGFMPDNALIENDTAYFHGAGNRLIKFNLAEGKIYWEVDTYKLETYGGYFSYFNTPVIKDGVVCFTDRDGHKVNVNDADGKVINYDRPVNNSTINPALGITALAMAGYYFYEMQADKNYLLSGIALGLNAAGWMDYSIINIPFFDDSLSKACMMLGGAVDLAYPVITLINSIEKNDNASMWRAAGGIGVMLAVPLAAAFFMNNHDKNNKEEQPALIVPLVNQEYTGVDVRIRF